MIEHPDITRHNRYGDPNERPFEYYPQPTTTRNTAVEAAFKALLNALDTKEDIADGKDAA